MKHWYVVKKSYSDNLKIGDVIGFPRRNPNLMKFVNGAFVPSAEWLYIGRWEEPPIGEIIEAADLMKAAIQEAGRDENK
jgi:hypothetical protein